MKISKRIFYIIETLVGVLFALMTLRLVAACLCELFNFRYFVVLSTGRLVASIIVTGIIGAAGGYASYLCIRKNLNGTIFFLIIPSLLLVFFFGGMMYMHFSYSTGSMTKDVEHWGHYDHGVEERLLQEPFSLFPTDGSRGVAKEYEYEYCRYPFSESVGIHASETVSQEQFQATLAMALDAENILQSSQNGMQTTIQIGTIGNSITLQFDAETLEISYEIARGW